MQLRIKSLEYSCYTDLLYFTLFHYNFVQSHFLGRNHNLHLMVLQGIKRAKRKQKIMKYLSNI